MTHLGNGVRAASVIARDGASRESFGDAGLLFADHLGVLESLLCCADGRVWAGGRANRWE